MNGFLKDGIKEMTSRTDPSWFECVGNLHIHSSYSDGAGTLIEIVSAAKGAGLDFIVINDHNYMTDDLHLEEEGIYDGVRVLRGLEIGGRHHHYLAFDLKEMIGGNNLPPQEAIDKVNAQGGFGFMAHPFEKGMPFVEKSVAYTWNDLTVRGYSGICLWNFMSRWKERIKTPLHGLYCLLFKTESLKGPSRKTLSFWDETTRTRRVAAIGGSDAHGAAFRWGMLKFVPVSYAFLLNSINVHLLLKTSLPSGFSEAKRSIYEALREGRLFVAHDGLSAARGFRFECRLDDGACLAMGQERTFERGRCLIDSPMESEIRLLRNGKEVRRRRGRNLEFRLDEPGVYRVEVYRRLFAFGWRPWIFSNPIYLRET